MDNETVSKFINFSSGSLLYQRELELISGVLLEMKSANLIVQMGSVLLSGHLPFQGERCLSITDKKITNNGIVADYCALPLAAHSVDCVILPHVLFFYTKQTQQQILKEVYRVLKSEGRLVICEFSPHSLWRFSFIAQNMLPPKENCLGSGMLTHQLLELGFECESSHFFNFLPFSLDSQRNKNLSVLENLGEKWWPYLAAAYGLVLKKKVIYLRPLSEELKCGDMIDIPIMQSEQIELQSQALQSKRQ